MTENNPLIDLVSSVSGEAFLKVEENLGNGFVRLRVAEAERRQAKHDVRSFEDVVIEMLRNARDAHAQRIFVATTREGDVRRFTMIDDGVGIPTALHTAIFEPRVTSKLDTMVMDRWGVHGRGMALYSVASNTHTCRVAASDVHKGASIMIESDVNALAERADQSSWPVIVRDEAGSLSVVRGPHNITRRVLEFACEHPELDVYLGTPVEILSTVHALAQEAVGSSTLLFCEDEQRLPVWQRPATAGDAGRLVSVAEEIALPVSERTAHRILAGELGCLEPVLRQAQVEEDRTPAATSPDIYRDRRGLQIHHGDLGTFKKDLADAFDTLAERYYLQLRGEPRVTVGKDRITVRFDVDKED